MQQWIDLARSTGLQPRKSEKVSLQTSDAEVSLQTPDAEVSLQTPDSSTSAALDCNVVEDTNLNDESTKQ